jgi:uncharacterized phiE125 gp8 family phage protein
MFTTQKLVLGPYAEPLHLNDAKRQANYGIDTSQQDPTIRGKIAAARESVERDTMRTMLWQKRSLTLDTWPDRLDIYCCPVRADMPVAITYYDSGGTLQTLATSVYKVRYDLEPATITLKSQQTWPLLLDEDGVITVVFTAGYAVPFTADDSTDILTFVGYTPTNGDSFLLSNSGGSLPGGLATHTPYYVVSASGSTCKLSASSGGAAIDLTSAGTGQHFLGVVAPTAMEAMKLKFATSFVAREGDVPEACEDSYYSMLKSLKYTFL